MTVLQKDSRSDTTDAITVIPFSAGIAVAFSSQVQQAAPSAGTRDPPNGLSNYNANNHIMIYNNAL